MEDIAQNLKKIRDTLSDGVSLIAVTEIHTYREINEAIKHI